MNKVAGYLAKSNFAWKLNLFLLATILVADGFAVRTQRNIRHTAAEITATGKQLDEAEKRLKQQAAQIQALRAKLLAENPCLVIPAHIVWSKP